MISISVAQKKIFKLRTDAMNFPEVLKVFNEIENNSKCGPLLENLEFLDVENIKAYNQIIFRSDISEEEKESLYISSTE